MSDVTLTRDEIASLCVCSELIIEQGKAEATRICGDTLAAVEEIVAARVAEAWDLGWIKGLIQDRDRVASREERPVENPYRAALRPGEGSNRG